MKNVIITGASSGIGLDLVNHFLKHEYKVWACLRNPESLTSLQKANKNLLLIKCDVTSESDIQNAFNKVAEQQTSISEIVLINNAGLANGGPIEFLDTDDWRGLFEVNVFGLFAMTKAFLPLIRKFKGKIINIGSLSGLVAPPFLSTYAASKFAVRAFTDSLRREMLPFGVHVVLVQPGPIKTEIWGKSVDNSLKYKSRASADLQNLYSQALDSLIAGVKKSEESAIPVEQVSKLIHSICESENPKSHYLIGRNIKFISWFIRLIPTRWLDRILAKGFRSVE